MDEADHTASGAAAARFASAARSSDLRPASRSEVAGEVPPLIGREYYTDERDTSGPVPRLKRTVASISNGSVLPVQQ